MKNLLKYVLCSFGCKNDVLIPYIFIQVLIQTFWIKILLHIPTYVYEYVADLPSSINVWWTRIRQVKVKNIEFTRRRVPLLSMAVSKLVFSYADNQPQALKNPIFNNVYLGTAVMWLRVFLKWYMAAILVDDNSPNHRVKKLKCRYQIE